MSFKRRDYNLKQQANLNEWFETRQEATKIQAAIAWACEQDDSIVRLMELLNKCEQVGDCLIWTGAKSGRGNDKTYASIGVVIEGIGTPAPGVRTRGHRLIYALTNGIEALPEGRQGPSSKDLVLDHICGNALCLQPAHLQLITQGENSSLKGKERIAPPLSFGRHLAGERLVA